MLQSENIEKFIDWKIYDQLIYTHMARLNLILFKRNQPDNSNINENNQKEAFLKAKISNCVKG